MKVKDLRIREIFATNARKTIEVELETEKGKVKSSVPFGTSKGKYEVKQLETNQALNKFSFIRRAFISKEFSEQKEVDDFLRIIDKTENFEFIGGNVALAISSAFLKGFALAEGKEIFEFLSEKPTIPKPVCNVAGGWKGQSDIQEYLLLPIHQESFKEIIEKISEVYLQLGKKLKENDKNFNFGKNIESAWLTSLHPEKVLSLLSKFSDENLKIGLDIAASQIWDGEYYVYSNGEKLTATEQLMFVADLAERYPIIYIEDPFQEDDFVSFSALTSRLENKLIVGDDIYASNLKRLKSGLEIKATNAIIIKPNQIGTISDVIELVKFAKKNKIVTIVSHRSAETDDALICHLACGLNCDYVKIGIAGERIFKINEMIRIEEKLKESS
jgi:enolase